MDTFKATKPRLVIWLMSLILFSSEQGAYTNLFAAASPLVREKAELYKGGYLVPFGELEQVSADAENEELAKRMWETAEEIVKNWE
jgi:hypothetical protein